MRHRPAARVRAGSIFMSSRPKSNRPLRVLDRRLLALVHGGDQDGAAAPSAASTAVYVGNGLVVHAPHTGDTVRMAP
jgi:hypothetical protein